MDFTIRLLRVQISFNILLVIVDRLMKLMHFLPVKGTTSINQLEKLYVREIVRLHVDGNTKFVSTFQKSWHKSLGRNLAFSTVYHPQTNSQTERTKKVLENMLRTYCLDHKASQVEMLCLVDFAYNNSYQETIQMTPYKTLYDRRCCSHLQ